MDENVCFGMFPTQQLCCAQKPTLKSLVQYNIENNNNNDDGNRIIRL